MRRRKRNTKIEIGESSREVNKRGIRRRRVEQSRKPRERSKKKEQNSMVSGAGAQREGIEVKKRKKRRWTLRAVSTASAPVFIGRTFSYPKYSTQERKHSVRKRRRSSRARRRREEEECTGNIFGEFGVFGVVKGARGESQFLHLLLHGLHDKDEKKCQQKRRQGRGRGEGRIVDHGGE